jgi:EAL domain-containing protein (putative c-di-GMP-specific phosphodiesterase class I)
MPSHQPAATAFVPDLSEGAETGVYLALLELIDEGLIITSDELVIDANSAACRLLGRDYRDIVARPLAALFPTEADFLDARRRLFIDGEHRGTLDFALPDHARRALDFIAAPRLRPGLHAIVLAAHTDAAARAPAAHSAHELDQRMRQARSTLVNARRVGGARSGTYLSPFDSEDGFDIESLESGLARALAGDELKLQFQPLVDARARSLFGGEALLRWQHPERGLLPFQRFSHAIGNPELRVALDSWALTHACRSASRWPTPAAGQGVRVTVNLSIERLLAPGLADTVRRALRDSGLPARLLELDLPEQTLELDNARSLETLRELRSSGVRLAIDGFGAGLSSIARLRRAAVHAVKLDPEIVRGVGKDEDSEAIVEAIGAMAGALGLEVHARGVEDRGQQAFLVALGCHLQQGALFGPPVDAQQFARGLDARPG